RDPPPPRGGSPAPERANGPAAAPARPRARSRGRSEGVPGSLVFAEPLVEVAPREDASDHYEVLRVDHLVNDSLVAYAIPKKRLRRALERFHMFPGRTRINHKSVDSPHHPFAFFAAELPQRSHRLASELDAPHGASASRR